MLNPTFETKAQPRLPTYTCSTSPNISTRSQLQPRQKRWKCASLQRSL